MKVLEVRKRKPYHIYCTCGALLEVEYTDVQIDWRINGRGPGTTVNYIVCPICKTTIDLPGNKDHYFPWVQEEVSQ